MVGEVHRRSTRRASTRVRRDFPLMIRCQVMVTYRGPYRAAILFLHLAASVWKQPVGQQHLCQPEGVLEDDRAESYRRL